MKRNSLPLTYTERGRYLAPSTDERYVSFMRKRRQQPTTEIIHHSAKAHWIGSPEASKILVVFHGGGYINPILEPHLEFYYKLKETLTIDASIVILSYYLTPESQYPVQLQQAVGLLYHLVTRRKKKPENVSRVLVVSECILIGHRSSYAAILQEVIWHWVSLDICYIRIQIVFPSRSIVPSKVLLLSHHGAISNAPQIHLHATGTRIVWALERTSTPPRTSWVMPKKMDTISRSEPKENGGKRSGRS